VLPRVARTQSSSSKSSWPSTRASLRGGVFSLDVVDQRPGLIVAHVSGAGAWKTFQHEPGGHRWQRVPKTEKRGRVHTSTVTVAVLAEPTQVELRLPDRDLEWSTCRGSGAGGQHRNVTNSAVQVKHLPTGTLVRCESGRSQHANRAAALALLRAKLWDQKRLSAAKARATKRKAQVGSGQRGDKRRTIRVQDGRVTDHITGRSWRFKDYVRGLW
jgi:peptide chain release factor 1